MDAFEMKQFVAGKFAGMLIMAASLLYGCRPNWQDPPLFETLGSDSTGIMFVNKLNPTPEFNLFSYMYYYNGAGIGAADFNNDGSTDLFFAANQGRNALYLNKGDMKFEDATESAGIPDDGAWSTGVSVVDINQDGLMDIYICRVGQYKVLKGRNLLLVCNGIDQQGVPHYRDEAEAYGLAFSGFSTHAAFFDYDLDGDQDLYLLNHSVNHDGNYAPRSQFMGTTDSLAGHRLYRNDSRIGTNGSFMPKFVNTTALAGINSSRIGYGLGVVVSDVNLDGWPDIYVGNDFHENDYLYINNRNGTFTESGTTAMQHTSQFSMGVDAADINNDGFPEIVSMDMLPDDPVMLRRSLTEDDYNIYQQKISYGYSYQYARNNLQLNRGDGTFSEIGQFAGIYATDWTWSALFMDFDNDGLRDLFVSNGIPKRMNDIDYINFVSGDELQNRLRNNTLQDKDLALINRFPEIKLPNHFFRNNGNLTFSEPEHLVANNRATFSNGAVYADFDNDGDLDVVVNNIDDEALVYRNLSDKGQQKAGFSSLKLEGAPSNRNAFGARLLVYSGSSLMYYEKQPVHGFLSSMEAPLHVGMKGIKADSALLVWPDNSYETINLLPDSVQKAKYRPGLPAFDFNQLHQRAAASYAGELKDLTEPSGLIYRHEENNFNEFTREALLPRMVSTEGPAIAVADINRDGLDDVFVGASKSFVGAVFLQAAGGKFERTEQPVLHADSMWEHVDAQWADLNGDGFTDLVIATGGNEYYGEDEHLHPLLYLNDGKGKLLPFKEAFKGIYATQSRVLVSDFTGDGVPDLFIAGRAVPWQYGLSPRSYLLKNDGKGQFTDVTNNLCPALERPGMVNDAHLTDLNGDKLPDLVLSLEWGGIKAYFRKKKGFEEQTIYPVVGWWQCVRPADVDSDGDTDLIAGNFGLNSRLKASSEQPVRLYLNDFDENGRTEQVMTYYLKNKEIPFASKLQLEKQMPVLKKRYLYADDFSKAGVSDLFGEKNLDNATTMEATGFEHVVLLNDGKGRFSAKPLPAAAQLTTIRAIMPVAANANGLTDYLLMGNFYDYNVELGRQDAGTGICLLNKGGGNFEVKLPAGYRVEGQVRRIVPIRVGDRSALLFVRNNLPLVLAELR